MSTESTHHDAALQETHAIIMIDGSMDEWMWLIDVIRYA
jgi:hypothetical protein